MVAASLEMTRIANIDIKTATVDAIVVLFISKYGPIKKTE